jgi:hypothetical protein
MALTKPSREIVYTFISDIEVQNGLEQTADPKSATQTYSDLQKEAESFFSSISERAAQVGGENNFRHISVTALPRLAYQWLPPMPPLPPCPRFIRMGRPETARRGSLLNSYGVGVGESIHPAGARL